MKIYRIATIAVALLLLFSCEELFFEPVPDTSPASIFDQTWTFADREYSFFAYKGVDWDAARETYRSRVSDDMDDRALFDVLADMLFELRDGHVNLTSDFDRSRNWQWYLEAEPNYDYSVLERYYFRDEVTGQGLQQYVGSAFVLMDFTDPTEGDVGYIHYRSFANPVRTEDMDYVIARFGNHAGLIIDMRNNGGGSISNVYAIGNRLTSESVRFAEETAKVGPGHEDFGPPRSLYLRPEEGRSTFTKPIVVLTNRMCYSATNYFVTAMTALDHVVTMGDRTGGGGGVPANTQLTNGWGLRVSSTRLFRLDSSGVLTDDERNVEDGLDPDIPESSAAGELAVGTDAILDAALLYIRTR